jgi:chromosome segregation ATPase
MRPVKFEELEEKLERILSGTDTIDVENRRLKDSLKAKEAEIRSLRKRLKRLDRDKGEAAEKVDSLLTRLNGLIQKA